MEHSAPITPMLGPVPGEPLQILLPNGHMLELTNHGDGLYELSHQTIAEDPADWLTYFIKAS